MCQMFVSILILLVIIYTIGGVMCLLDCNNTQIKSMKVFGGFRVGQHIGLLAELEFQNSTSYRSVFYVIYYGLGNIEVMAGVVPTTRAPDLPNEFYPYFQFREFDKPFSDVPWQQRGKFSSDPTAPGLFENMFSFSTQYIKVFEDSKSSEIIFFNDTNGVTAYQISVINMFKSIILHPGESKVIYKDEPSKATHLDVSEDLNLYYMFVYFPPDLKINAILVVEKPKELYEFQDIVGKHQEYYALIYTTMVYNNTVYRFRQRMESTNLRQGSNVVPKLIWNFDEKQEFCDALDVEITGVALLHSHYQTLTTADGTAYRSDSKDFYFLEFSKTKHRVMKMHFNSKTLKIEIGSIRTDPFAQNEWIDNTKLYHCRVDPYNWLSLRKKCREDYPEYRFDEMPGVVKDLNKEQGSEQFVEKESKLTYLFFFASIVIMIAILGVIAFGVYVVFTASTDEQK